MRIQVLASIAAGALFLTGCSKPLELQRQEGLPALTAEQSDRLLNTLGDIGMAVAVISGVSSTNRIAMLTGFWGLTPDCGTTCDTTTLDQDSEEMANALANAISVGDCDVPSRLPPDLNIPVFKDGEVHTRAPQSFDFIIRGDRCPVTLRFKGTASGDAAKAETQYEVSYKVQDAAMRGISKIEQADLKGESKFSAESINKGSMSFVLKGTMKSIEDGNVEVGLQNKRSSEKTAKNFIGNSTVLLSVSYATFTGQVYASSERKDGKNNVEFLLNSQKITQEQFEMFMAEAGLSGRRPGQRRPK